MQDIAFNNARDKGFHDNEIEFGTWIALIHSELSEALEYDRIGNSAGVAEELADVVIRVGDLCGLLNIDLESEIKKKMKINFERPRLHGKRY
jgi:NTP pyrophosphatase (non-canonical NTP hydrolase)